MFGLENNLFSEHSLIAQFYRSNSRAKGGKKKIYYLITEVGETVFSFFFLL